MNKRKRYIIDMVISFLAYGLGLVALNYWFEPNNNYLIALLPILPLVYLSASIVRFVTKLDEMQKKIIFEAMAFSGLASGFSCFSYLFLRGMGAPEFQAEWAFYIILIFFGIGIIFSSRRY